MRLDAALGHIRDGEADADLGIVGLGILARARPGWRSGSDSMAVSRFREGRRR
jgi:hypothetical protein